MPVPILIRILVLVLPTLALVLGRVLCYASPLLFHVSRLFFQGLFLFYSEFANKAEAGNNFCCFTDGPDGRERNGKSHIKMALNGFGRRVSASVLLIALSLLSGALILPPAAAQRDENVG